MFGASLSLISQMLNIFIFTQHRSNLYNFVLISSFYIYTILSQFFTDLITITVFCVNEMTSILLNSNAKQTYFHALCFLYTVASMSSIVISIY
jgi:hypothetical protein